MIQVLISIPNEKLPALAGFLTKEGLGNASNPSATFPVTGSNQSGGAIPQAEKSAQPSGKPGRPTKAEKEAKEKAAQAQAAPAEKEEVSGDDSGWGDEGESEDDKPLTPDQRSKLMVALKQHSKANSFDETKALLKETTGTNDPAKVTRGYFDAVMKALA